ncbi:amidohydrolase family protein, partial [Idiomarina baltica]
MPANQAIQAATIAASDILRDPRLGRIKSGSYADIIAVDGNPLEDITELQRVTFVMKDGEIHKQ